MAHFSQSESSLCDRTLKFLSIHTEITGIVYVINDNKAHAIPVKTGYHNGDRVEIISGLEGAEIVATDGAAFLTDGASVEVVL